MPSASASPSSSSGASSAAARIGADADVPDAFADAIARFCDHLALERRYSPNTVAAYRRDLVGYAARCGRAGLVSPADVDRRFLRSYLAALGTLGYARSSIARKASSLRSFHGWARRVHLTASDPAAQLAAPAPDRRLPRVPSAAQLGAVLDACDTSPRGVRDRALIELLYSSGLRIGELCSLTVGDLEGLVAIGANGRTGWLTVWGKGAKQRRVPVGAPAVVAVDAWLATGRPAMCRGDVDAEAGFVNTAGRPLSPRDARRILTARAALSPHALRHACATHTLDGGADIRVVQELLGHGSLTTTQAYTHLTAEALRNVFDQAHPRA